MTDALKAIAALVCASGHAEMVVACPPGLDATLDADGLAIHGHARQLQAALNQKEGAWGWHWRVTVTPDGCFECCRAPLSRAMITPDWVTAEALRVFRQNVRLATQVNRQYDDQFMRGGKRP